ncbi:uncharacterized protein RHIMIDRAFT_234007 [Rhizopus microsporus ATCC 52813]|uniref:Uncharacterized protein n=1 Tax=Rhizopus microsporus ATCC 52813 TaxID=1340429 RepID=A0A2G4T5X3_RHIZD|nr:uncharacterized protein RHIMIDRAFT_234007 [Rhizopus microsporus ATCC 52813]PHZ16412.1 hypothetical protein RHIMIDRAFT_234007 [Rhizopus microsporus ATCC 52813]
MESEHNVQQNQSFFPEQIEELYQQFAARFRIEEEGQRKHHQLILPEAIQTDLEETPKLEMQSNIKKCIRDLPNYEGAQIQPLSQTSSKKQGDGRFMASSQQGISIEKHEIWPLKHLNFLPPLNTSKQVKRKTNEWHSLPSLSRKLPKPDSKQLFCNEQPAVNSRVIDRGTITPKVQLIELEDREEDGIFLEEPITNNSNQQRSSNIQIQTQQASSTQTDRHLTQKTKINNNVTMQFNNHKDYNTINTPANNYSAPLDGILPGGRRLQNPMGDQTSSLEDRAIATIRRRSPSSNNSRSTIPRRQYNREITYAERRLPVKFLHHTKKTKRRPILDCRKAIKIARHSTGLLLRRHLFTRKVRSINGKGQGNCNQPFEKDWFPDQLEKELFRTMPLPRIPGIPVQYKENVDHSPATEDQQTISKNQASQEQDNHQNIQMDGKLTGDDGVTDSSDQRSSTTRTLPTKGRELALKRGSRISRPLVRTVYQTEERVADTNFQSSQVPFPQQKKSTAIFRNGSGVFACPYCDGTYYQTPNTLKRYVKDNHDKEETEADSDDDSMVQANCLDVTLNANRHDHHTAVLSAFDAMGESEKEQGKELLVAELGDLDPIAIVDQEGKEYNLLANKKIINTIIELNQTSVIFYLPKKRKNFDNEAEEN